MEGKPLDLEEEFFAKKNARLLQEMRKKTEHEEQREALRKVVAVQDDAFLDRLIAMGIVPERAMVLRLIPLIFVAWADGSVDERMVTVGARLGDQWEVLDGLEAGEVLVVRGQHGLSDGDRMRVTLGS